MNLVPLITIKGENYMDLQAITNEKMKKFIERTIAKTIEKTTEATIKEFKRQGLMKDNKHTPFQKTETLLYNYMSFKKAVSDKYKQIEIIRTEGLDKKSKSIVFCSSNPKIDLSDDEDKADARIERLEAAIYETNGYISLIDSALDMLKDDPYYDVISMKYFEGMTREQIADEFGVDVRTITRHKNRLINLLQIRLFSDEFLEDMLGLG